MRFRIMPLEERIVLDAAAIHAVLSPHHFEHAHHADAYSELLKHSIAPANSDVHHTDKTPFLDHSISLHPDSGIHLLLISSDIKNLQNLSAEIQASTEILIYDPAHNNLQSLAAMVKEALQGKQADSITFADNSSNGQFALLHDVSVTRHSLEATPALHAFWQNLGTMLNDGGHVDLLSANAVNAAGQTITSDIQVHQVPSEHATAVDLNSLTPTAALPVNQIVFTDLTGANYNILVQDLATHDANGNNIEIVALNPNQNGIAQITSVLSGQKKSGVGGYFYGRPNGWYSTWFHVA